MAVDGNEHRGDQFRSSLISERRVALGDLLLFLSRRGRTRGSIDRRYSDVLARRQHGRKDMRNFVEEAADQNPSRSAV